ncbi:MAG: nicotinate-nucleotide adenylyltransferase [Tenuifilum sp.]|jgi:nicotinate-nucleotide adenylyltransferase|uniref:nicotinate (nicotinamide) nucleotide adenylyltransferase n=1 Tax=Tenuifilum sp. TaxID=2760880 RepID=UPI0024AA0ACE|nr:nicotinate (nicotinamide) nucleotide adenylyltransferase [Tenuifilum sp.]MDI3528131.1 nicotinate-nucleotide adenylyltransferase [Tenuifilum sp.]
MKVGLFFGSFNPIHTGHLVIAEYILEFSDLDEIWFVVSPLNPLKKADELESDEHRLNMAKLAIHENNTRLKVCDVEMNLPRPSYTIDTLKVLKSTFPDYNFVLIIGSDTVETLPKWKGYDELISSYDFMVYPRECNAYKQEFPSERFSLVDAPIIGISATLIRSIIAKDKDVLGYVPDDVWDYIERNRLYGYKGIRILNE